MTYIVVFRKKSDGKTDCGVAGAYSDRKEAEEYILNADTTDTDYTIAEM